MTGVDRTWIEADAMGLEVEGDVVVVGGGPAGFSCATELARCGFKTLRLEEHASVAARVQVIGEAAGPVKATTGGGSYDGWLAARLAADTIATAFARGGFTAAALSRDERRWPALMAVVRMDNSTSPSRWS
jgi:flavin-dependent dehydrogenase